VRRVSMSPTAIKRRRSLRIIAAPDPETRSVFEKTAGATDSVFFAGNQTTDAYVCGNCGAMLVVGLPLGLFQNLVLRCSACGEHNETQVAPSVSRARTGQSSRRRKSGRR
jgi:hypothetical protein